jgi:hypothetical protein
MFVSQLLTPERLVQFYAAQPSLHVIVPEEIILQLFSADELVQELLFPHLELNERERAILKASILQVLNDSEELRERLRQRIRAVLSALGKLPTSAADTGQAAATGTEPPPTPDTTPDKP